MPRIEFYTLAADSPGDRYLLCCRLVEDLYAQGRRVLIHCPDRATAEHLDRLLWTWRQASFIPHGLVGRTDPAVTPVLIGLDGTPADLAGVLINLAPGVPPFYARFAQVCEPVDQDPAQRAAARERFRVYRDQGHPPEHRDLRLDREDAQAR